MSNQKSIAAWVQATAFDYAELHDQESVRIGDIIDILTEIDPVLASHVEATYDEDAKIVATRETLFAEE